MKNVVFFLLVLLALAPAGAEVLRHTDEGFSINLVEGWSGQALKPDQDSLVAQLSLTDSAAPYAEFFVQRYPRNDRSLEGFVLQSRFHVVVEQGGRMLEDSALKIAGIPGHKMIFTGHDEQGQEMRYYRVLLAHPRYVYVLFGLTTPDGLARYKADFNSMAASFRTFAPGIAPLQP